VRSWGLVRKRGNAGKQAERFEVLGACIGGSSTVSQQRDQHSHHKLARVYTGCHIVSSTNMLRKYCATIKAKGVSTIPRHTYNTNTRKKPTPQPIKPVKKSSK
jgi:hypothetical protein